jgi:hypothetical protein
MDRYEIIAEFILMQQAVTLTLFGIVTLYDLLLHLIIQFVMPISVQLVLQ